MVLRGTTSGLLLQEYQSITMIVVAATVPVHSILVQLHLHSWERVISVNLGTLDDLNVSGTLMTLCGTHRGVKVGAPAVIVVIHGSLPRLARKQVMTLK